SFSLGRFIYLITKFESVSLASSSLLDCLRLIVADNKLLSLIAKTTIFLNECSRGQLINK
ncbi:hypothetical protein GIB67_013269, partial [Kingdonia uniflora]